MWTRLLFYSPRRELTQLRECKMRQALHLIETPKQFHFPILTAYHVLGRLLMKKRGEKRLGKLPVTLFVWFFFKAKSMRLQLGFSSPTVQFVPTGASSIQGQTPIFVHN